MDAVERRARDRQADRLRARQRDRSARTRRAARRRSKDKDYNDARFATQIAALGGVGDFDADTLDKVLAGKQVAVATAIGETIGGRQRAASPRDLETMFQLVYLRMTQPRKDEERSRVLAGELRRAADEPAALARVPVLPRSRRRRSTTTTRAAALPKPEDFAKVDLDKALAFYKERFGDVARLHVRDRRRGRPREAAAAGRDLPREPAGEGPQGEGEGPRRSARSRGVVKKSRGRHRAEGVGADRRSTATTRGRATRSATSYILGQVLVDPAARGAARGHGRRLRRRRERLDRSRSPHQERSFSITFGCDPERVDELIKATYDEIARGREGRHRRRLPREGQADLHARARDRAAHEPVLARAG